MISEPEVSSAIRGAMPPACGKMAIGKAVGGEGGLEGEGGTGGKRGQAPRVYGFRDFCQNTPRVHHDTHPSTELLDRPVRAG